MAEVDTSIYANQVKPPDMMGTLSGVANLQSQMNQNKLFQQEYNTKLGLSQIYKDAIGPNGEIDFGKIPAMAAGPQGQNILLGLPEAIKNSLAATGQNLTNSGQKISNSTAQMTNTQTHIANATAAVSQLINDPNLTDTKIISVLAGAVAKGQLTPDEMVQLHDHIPRLPDGSIDQEKTQGILQHMQMQLMSPSERYNIANPETTMVNNGQAMVPYQMRRGQAPVRLGEGIQMQPSPTTIYYDANGQAHLVGTMGNQGVQPAPGQPGQGVGMGGGVQGPPATPGQVSQGGGMGGAGQGGLPPGTLAAAPPGVPEAAGVDATRSAGAWANLRDQTADASTQIFQLGKAMEGIMGANTGPGSDALNNAKSFLMTIDPGILKKLGLTDPAGVKSYDEANKYLMANALSASGSLGEGTDSKIASAITANASTHISNLAAQDVIKANIALVKAKQAQALAFQQSGLPSGKFSDWAVQWSKNNDPRAFLADQQSAKERRAMMDKMNAREMAAYVSSFKSAAKNGVINLLDLPK